MVVYIPLTRIANICNKATATGGFYHVEQRDDNIAIIHLNKYVVGAIQDKNDVLSTVVRIMPETPIDFIPSRLNPLTIAGFLHMADTMGVRVKPYSGIPYFHTQWRADSIGECFEKMVMAGELCRDYSSPDSAAPLYSGGNYTAALHYMDSLGYGRVIARGGLFPAFTPEPLLYTRFGFPLVFRDPVTHDPVYDAHTMWNTRELCIDARQGLCGMQPDVRAIGRRLATVQWGLWEKPRYSHGVFTMKPKDATLPMFLMQVGKIFACGDTVVR